MSLFSYLSVSCFVIVAAAINSSLVVDLGYAQYVGIAEPATL